jgi:DNA repair exonuclease SbcCD ATPase subunit
MSTVAKKTTAKKPAAKKPAAKKPAAKKPAFKPENVGKASAENLHSASKNIDKQMKKLATIDTRVLIAKDKLAELQGMIAEKREEFKELDSGSAKRALENARKKLNNHKDVMSSIRETRADIVQRLNDSKSIHKAYESAVKHLEKGKETAMREAKKAEVNFMKKLHKVEEKMLKKAAEIKKNLNL